ncbi:hypothetical protein [Hyphomicrobium sp.]|jgi:hypothetical protein|uniref:hypothetical protein n=1 Tax=Hyphomicrobium sp. TaxID=82 RepID=UPI000FA909D2|nr:hypothetical protein [Hyphomicrobium sp.]RUO97714.1 MAG: hypothetical protein EKK30_13245 [Hyphomicrobium sp.]
MLRRYLLVNGTTTALLYGGIYAATPSTGHLVQTARDFCDGFVMQSPILGPIINKVVLLISAI